MHPSRKSVNLRSSLSSPVSTISKGPKKACRACERCTRTKKKCDKALPNCSRCKRYGYFPRKANSSSPVSVTDFLGLGARAVMTLYIRPQSPLSHGLRTWQDLHPIPLVPRSVKKVKWNLPLRAYTCRECLSHSSTFPVL